MIARGSGMGSLGLVASRNGGAGHSCALWRRPGLIFVVPSEVEEVTKTNIPWDGGITVGYVTSNCLYDTRLSQLLAAQNKRTPQHHNNN